MEREKLNLTPEDGYRALQGHLVDKAKLARERYGPAFSAMDVVAMLEDRDIVRHPTQLVYDSSKLQEGEFALAIPVEGSDPRAYELVVHEHFRGRESDLAFMVGYHIPTINYLDIVTHAEAEMFGAALLGIEVEVYYERICQRADELEAS